MAVTGTQLYNKKQSKIYPISDGEVIISTASGKTSTVHKDLVELFNQIAKLSGDQDAVNNLTISVKYAKTNTKEKAEVMDYEETKWSNDFSIPSMKYPYIWKRTTFGYKGNDDAFVFYEICAVDVTEKTQTIYIAKTTGAAPVIEYPLNADGSKKLDYYDNFLPTDWTETPQSITPATPYVFMATRKTKEGKWLEFSNPAQLGRWAFDSMLELRYCVTAIGETPDVDYTEENPGEQWKTKAPTTFTGQLWMITATSVNSVFNVDGDKNIWKGPNLMGIVQ